MLNTMKSFLRKITPRWMKLFFVRLFRSMGQATRMFRVLPNFIIIGGQKCGTTSLYRYLGQHPQIRRSWTKEVNYFNQPVQPSVGWYRGHFPLKSAMRNGDQAFEASPNYLFDPKVPERMHALLPDAKLIVLLRNPTDRASSQYFQSVRRGQEPLSMQEAFRQEASRLAPSLEVGSYDSFELINRAYLHRGHYSEQLKPFLAQYPREQLLVIQSEAFFSSPQTVLKQIFEFLGVDPEVQIPNLKAYHVGLNNVGGDPELRAEWDAYFKAHNEALYELLGEDFGW